jgi:hypothetical protein
MTELVKKRKVRGGHRSYVKKLIGMTKELIASYEETAEAKLVLEEKKIAFTDKLRTLKDLNDEILNILCCMWRQGSRGRNGWGNRRIREHKG